MKHYLIAYYFSCHFGCGFGNIAPEIEGDITVETLPEIVGAIKDEMARTQNFKTDDVNISIINIIPLAAGTYEPPAKL